MSAATRAIDVRPPDTVVIRRGSFSVLLPRRSGLIAILMATVVPVAVVGSIAIGSANLSAVQAAAAVLGEGTRSAVLLVQQVRLPRIVAGLLTGAALGLAGCLTQTMSRNRLATPDVLGVTEGAAAGMQLTVLGSAAGLVGDWWAGPLGGMVAAGVVVFAAGGFGSRGYRVLVVGIAVMHLMRSLVDLGISQLNLSHASSLYAWSIGSLVGRGYSVAVPVAILLAVLIPIAILLGRRLALLRFDEDVAATLGLSIGSSRLLILALAVSLAGLGVGIGGPVSFVALSAPIIASRLVNGTHIPIATSALVGGLLVVVADTIGRTIAPPTEIPVGVVTTVLGGPFLLWVLLSDRQSRSF